MADKVKAAKGGKDGRSDEDRTKARIKEKTDENARKNAIDKEAEALEELAAAGADGGDEPEEREDRIAREASGPRDEEPEEDGDEPDGEEEPDDVDEEEDGDDQDADDDGEEVEKPRAKPVGKKDGNGKKAAAQAWDEVGWEDESIQSGGKFLPKYRGKRGRRDVIHVMPVPGIKLPVRVGTHWDNKRKAYHNCSRLPTCPACKKLGEDTASDRYAVPIVHIRSAIKKDVEPVGKVMIWIFGKDKYEQMRDVVLPEARELGKDITGVDIVVNCLDSQMQRLTLSVSQRFELKKSHVAAWKEDGIERFKAWLSEEFTDEAIAKSLVRERRSTEFDPDKFDEDDGDDRVMLDRPGRRNRRRRDDDREDEDDVGAELEDLVGDGEDL